MINRVFSRLKKIKNNSTVIILISVTLLFTIIAPEFLSLFNLRNMVHQNEYAMIVITGFAFIILGGGVDMSLGYQISLVSVVAGKMIVSGFSPILAIAIGIAVGMLCGLLNGAAIAFLNISPIIITLITQEFFHGVSYLLSKGVTYSGYPQALLDLTEYNGWFPSVCDFMVILCFLVLMLVFTYTIFGKNVLSMGYDERVLSENNISVKKYKIAIYVIGSFFYAVAAVILMSRQGLSTSNMGVGYEIEAIFGACIAGAGGILINRSEQKFRIPLINFYLGIMVLSVIENGIQLSGASQYIERVITSVVVLISLLITTLIPSFKRKSV